MKIITKIEKKIEGIVCPPPILKSVIEIKIPTFGSTDMNQLKKDFQQYNKNINGQLNKKEFTQCLVEHGFDTKDADRYFTIADVDKNKSINFTEFGTFVRTCVGLTQNNDVHGFLKMAFFTADSKKKGKLNESEFKKFMELAGAPLGFFEGKGVFKQFDENNNGSVDFDEITRNIEFKLIY